VGLRVCAAAAALSSGLLPSKVQDAGPEGIELVAQRSATIETPRQTDKVKEAGKLTHTRTDIRTRWETVVWRRLVEPS